MSGHNHLPVRLDDLKGILLKAGIMVRDLYQRKGAVEKKLDGTPLTRADVWANQFLYNELSRILPDAGWLSEESAPGNDRLRKEWVWVVDPLDGTKEFARNIPEFAISVALIRDHRVILSGVVNPITGEGAVGAIHGEVDFWGFSPSNPQAEKLGEATASISRTEVEDGTVIPYLSLVGATRTIGSVAYKLLRVAAGLEDLTFSVQGKWEWDIGGGVGLLNSVGKIYRRLDRKPCAFNEPNTRIHCGAVAGGKALVEEFLARWEKTEKQSS